VPTLANQRARKPKGGQIDSFYTGSELRGSLRYSSRSALLRLTATIWPRGANEPGADDHVHGPPDAPPSALGGNGRRDALGVEHARVCAIAPARVPPCASRTITSRSVARRCGREPRSFVPRAGSRQDRHAGRHQGGVQVSGRWSVVRGVAASTAGLPTAASTAINIRRNPSGPCSCFDPPSSHQTHAAMI
jgi:hypothetical protein